MVAPNGAYEFWEQHKTMCVYGKCVSNELTVRMGGNFAFFGAFLHDAPPPRVENKCKPFIVTMVLTKNATLIMYVCMLIKNAFKEPSRDLKAHTPRTRIYQKLIMRMGQK